VPLFLYGPGVAPAIDTRNASLVDLPRTIAELARVTPVPDWEGMSLLSAPSPAPAFAFDCAEMGEPSVAILDGDWKVVLGTENESFTLDEVRYLYDLGADPGEVHDLASEERRRVGALLGLHREELLRLLIPLQTGSGVEISPELMRRMKGLGY